jgi:hypothetical protein
MGSPKVINGTVGGDYVFIVESINSPLIQAPQNNTKYEFIAIVAKFGITNNNGREYMREDYIKHIPELKKRIDRRQLMGELDHPQGYDTSLKNVSHIITDIWYDETDDTVKIKIEVLNTPYGNIARTLIDSGVQLSTSSRSAGKVDGQGRVTLFKIFTFDLVAEPGFSQAVLQNNIPEKMQENFSMLTESLDNIRVNNITNTMMLVDEFNFFGGEAKIYKVNESDLASFEKVLNKHTPNKNNDDGMSSISKVEFDEYSKMMQKQFGELRGILEGIQHETKAVLEKKAQHVQAQAAQVQAQVQPQEQAQVQPQVQAQAQVQPQAQAQVQVQIEVQPQVQAQPAVSTLGATQPSGVAAQAAGVPGVTADGAMAQPVSGGLVQPVSGGLGNQLAQPTSPLIPTQQVSAAQPAGDQAATIASLIEYINVLAKQLQTVMNHSSIMTEQHNRLIGYAETLGQTTNELVNFVNVQSKAINESIRHSDDLARVINENGIVTESVIKYTKLLGKTLNESIQHSNVISERTEQAIKAIDFNAEIINEHIGHTNMLANVINTEDFKTGKVSGVEDRNLSSNISSITEGVDTLMADLDKVLTKVNERANTTVLESKYPFLQLLSENNKNLFYGLDNELKKEIVHTLNAGVYFSEGDVINTIQGIMESKHKELPNYIKFMPDMYKKAYSVLSEAQKAEIGKKAAKGFYKLNTAPQVRTFWNSLNLDLATLNEHAEKLEQGQTIITEGKQCQSTEGIITQSQFVDYKRGYSLDYIKSLTRHAAIH